VGFFNNSGKGNNSSNVDNNDDFKRKQMRLNFRLVGCAALGYIAFGLFRTPVEPEEAMNPILRFGIAGIFMGFAIIMGAITIKEYLTIRKEEKALQEAGETSESSSESEGENLDDEDDYDDGEWDDDDEPDDDEDSGETAENEEQREDID